MTVVLITTSPSTYDVPRVEPHWNGDAQPDLTPIFSNPSALIFNDKDRATEYLTLTHDSDLPPYLTRIRWVNWHNSYHGTEEVRICDQPFFKPGIPTDLVLAHLSTHARAYFLNQEEAASHCRANPSLTINTRMEGPFYVLRYDPIGIKRIARNRTLKEKSKLKSAITSGEYNLNDMNTLLNDLIHYGWVANEKRLGPLSIDTGYHTYTSSGGWGRGGRKAHEVRDSHMDMLNRLYRTKLALRWPTRYFVPHMNCAQDFLDAYSKLRPYLPHLPWRNRFSSLSTLNFLRTIVRLTRPLLRQHLINEKRRYTLLEKRAKIESRNASRRAKYAQRKADAAFLRPPHNHLPQAIADATANIVS